MERKGRVLIGKVGLDGHEVGARVVAKALSDAGFEVIYTGLRQRPEQIVAAAIEEDVDLIGISILSGAHVPLLGEVLNKLKEHKGDDIGLIAGGIIPIEDISVLKDMGVKDIFLPETPIDHIVNRVRKILQNRRSGDPKQNSI